MKNITTPRTLSDCQFCVGYRQVERVKNGLVVYLVACIILGVLIGYALAS